MKRWNVQHMLDIGHKLFAQIVRRKQAVNHNHEILFLAREINEWLPRGIQSMIDGNYTPRHLKRYYFADEMVDQLHPTDRVFQHILLKQLKPTFKHVMSENCYHLVGPAGVKHATQRIRQILQEEKPQYVLRADIRSYYRSISHFKLINDIKQLYDDPKVQVMLEEIIRNPIETSRGFKNPSTGIALRGPLSQFFSAIYLRKLDAAFDGMQVSYLRYQDDYIILCKTKRQLLRCRRRMMEVLGERGLSISRKKSYIGCISRGFHFLGVQYFPTQPENNTAVAHASNDKTIQPDTDSILSIRGGVEQYQNSCSMSLRALFRILEHCVRRASKSSQWSSMGFCPNASNTICIAGFCGG